MAPRSSPVDTFFAELEHPLKPGMESLRAAILDSNAEISEHIKWKAPSFCHRGDDRVTFRLPPKGGLQLIFHRGAKVKDVAGFRFEDASGLIAWAAVDRGVVTLTDGADVHAKTAALVRLVNAWMVATAEPVPAGRATR